MPYTSAENAATGTSLGVTLDYAIAAGDVLLAICENANLTTSVTSVSSSKVAWSYLRNIDLTNQNQNVELWVGRVQSSASADSETVTVTISNGESWRKITVSKYSPTAGKVFASSPVQQHVSTLWSSGSNPTSTDGLTVAIAPYGASKTFTLIGIVYTETSSGHAANLSSGTGFTEDFEILRFSSYPIHSEYKTGVSAGATNITATLSVASSGDVVLAGVALEEVASSFDGNNLVRYYFDEAAYGTSPTQVDDTSGNNYHLNSFDYNTTPQGVQIVNSSGDISRSANLPSPTNFTVAVWAHADSIRASAYGNVLMFHDSGNGRYLGITHENDSSGDYSLWYSPSGGGTTFDTFSSAPTVDAWAYFALRVSGTAIGDVEAMWWNGSSWVKVTNSQVIASLTLSAFYVGRSHTVTDYMLGKFCFARCWDAVLTDAELEAEKDAILAVRKQNLRWDWPLAITTDTNDWSENSYSPTLSSLNSNSADGPLSVGAYTADANGNRGFASLRDTSYTRVNRLIDHSTPDFLASAWDSGSKFTMEVVYYHKYGSTSNARIFCINGKAGDNPQLGLTIYEGAGYPIRIYANMNGSENYRFYSNVSTGKYVFHIVVDFTQATAADRMKLYIDGVLQTPGQSQTLSDQGATGSTIVADTDLIAFNRADSGIYARSPQGIIYYGAIYDDAFDATRVSDHYDVLSVNDDAPTGMVPSTRIARIARMVGAA